ncbi:MAG: GNAT family N-acetyltransferase [Bacillota bacterium]
MATTDLGGVAASVPPAQDLHRHARSGPRFPLGTTLLEEWDELAGRTAATPYLYPGWAQAWWRAFGDGEHDIRTVRKDGRLAALLPIVRRDQVIASAANYHTPGFGLLAENAGVAVELARGLFSDRPAWLSITSLDPVAASLQACQQAAEEAGYKTVVRPYQRSLYLDLKGSWHEYESRLGRNLLRNVRRARRHLEQEGVLSVEIADGRERLDELLHEAFGVEASGWKGARHTAIDSDPRTRAFYTEVAHWAAARGMLQLYFLRLERRPIAVYIALEHRRTCHLLKGGYDPAYRRHSPGNLLMHDVIGNCFAAGLSRIEFNGDAEPYKFSWAAAVRERKRFEAFAPTVRGRLAWVKFSVVLPFKRRLRRSVGLRPDKEP